jgi:TonB family protein
VELRLGTRRPEDRLATAVFVAALLHGLFILGLRFTVPSSDERPLPQVGVNASAAEETLRLRGDPAPDDRLLADTRESQIAAYLDGWKRRIEQVGTLNFPDEARRRALSGNPVLEVAIRADGHLEQVLVRRTSGHRELDAAAVRIVRLASPFDPFPPAVRDRYPLLRFAYEWQFLQGQLGGGAVWTAP